QALEPLHQAERVGAADREARELDAAAPARRERKLHFLALAGGQRGELAALHVPRHAPFDLPAPAEIAHGAVPPVAAFFARFARAPPCFIAGTRIAEALPHVRAGQRARTAVGDDHAVDAALARGGVARQLAGR